MSKEYIERGALLKHLCNSCDDWCENTNCDCVNCKSDHRCDIVQEIEEAPAADVVEVKHGYNLYDVPSLFECSVCHWECYDTYTGDTDVYNYCPNCGAKMDGGDE